MSIWGSLIGGVVGFSFAGPIGALIGSMLGGRISSARRSGFQRSFAPPQQVFAIALIILTAIVGIFYARVQGVQTLKSGITNLYSNKVPVYEMLSGASIAFAALLLIIPGFFTDFIGFLLLIPLTRNILFRLTLKRKPRVNEQNNKTIDGEIINKDKDEL